MAPRPGSFVPVSRCCRPGLPRDVVEQVLLRLPDPGALVRAATACKEWGSIISAPSFLRSYREHHLVGFVSNIQSDDSEAIVRFDATSPSSLPRRIDLIGYRALDARHGRVLLLCSGEAKFLAVWDPRTGDWLELPPLPPLHPQYFWNAAVICTERSGDHAFTILALCFDPSAMTTMVYICTSLISQWMRKETPWMLEVVDTPPALVRNCFFFCMDSAVLGYDLGSSTTIRIYLPKGSASESGRNSIYATRQHKLGFASLIESKVYTWELRAADMWEPIFSIDVN